MAATETINGRTQRRAFIMYKPMSRALTNEIALAKDWYSFVGH